jgi:hypothetical protein
MEKLIKLVREASREKVDVEKIGDGGVALKMRNSNGKTLEIIANKQRDVVIITIGSEHYAMDKNEVNELKKALK